MYSFIYGRNPDTALNDGTTEYMILGTTNTYSSTRANFDCPAPADFTIEAWKLDINTAPSSGKSWDFKILVNGTSQATITISNTSTLGNWSGSVSVSQGDLVCISYTGTSTPTAFTGLSQCIKINCSSGQPFFAAMPHNVTTSRNFSHWAAHNLNSAADTFASAPVPVDGTWKNLWVQLSVNVPTGATETILMRIANAGTTSFSNSSTLSVAITAGNNSGNSGAATQTRTAGQQADLRATGNTTALGGTICTGLLWVPDTDGYAITQGNSTSGQVATGSTEYIALQSGTSADWSSTETARDNRSFAATFYEHYFRGGAGPGTSETVTTTFRINAGSGTITAQVTGATIGGSDTGHSDVVAEDDLIDMSCARSSGAAAGSTRLGYCYRYIVTTASGTNTQVNIGDLWKTVEAQQVNIGDTWKSVAGIQVNISDSWKTIF